MGADGGGGVATMMKTEQAGPHGDGDAHGEKRAAARYRQYKLLWHWLGRVFLAALVGGTTLLFGGGLSQRHSQIYAIVLLTLVYAIFTKYFFRVSIRAKQDVQCRFEDYPLWPFSVEILLLTFLCLCTGGISSVYVSIFFIHAGLAYYALESKVKAWLLTAMTAGGLLTCILAGSVFATHFKGLVASEFQLGGANATSWSMLVYGIVIVSNLAFATAVSSSMSARVNADYYGGSPEALEIPLGPLRSYLNTTLDVDPVLTSSALEALVARLKIGVYRKKVDTLALQPAGKTLIVRAKLPQANRESSHGKILRAKIKSRAHERIGDALPKVLGDYDVKVTDADQCWVKLLLNFNQWMVDDLISDVSVVDRKDRRCYINCTREEFEGAMSSGVIRRGWLALLPYCLRPKGCKYREEITCPRYDDPGILCVADNGNGTPHDCLAYECYRTLNQNGVFARFIRNDDKQVQLCVNAFLEATGSSRMFGVMVVCCPRALIHNYHWFTDPSYGYPRTPVTFLSIASYEGCRYYPTNGLESGVTSTFDAQQLKSLFGAPAVDC